MRAKKYPSRWRLRKLFKYDRKTGQFLWREDRGPKAPKGGVAGFPTPDGTWRLWVKERIISAQTAAWIYVHGKPPPGPIKHINGDRMDNRIENLCLLKGTVEHTLESVQAKCHVVGDCWHWQAGKSGKTPAIHDGEKMVNARRYIFTRLLGLEIGKGRMVTMSCGNLDCVAPDHLVQRTRAQLQRDAAKRTQYGNNAARSARISKAKRAQSRYSDEFVEHVRQMEGSSRAIAKELGICASVVRSWRNYEVRTPASNPWTGLLLAA